MFKNGYRQVCSNETLIKQSLPSLDHMLKKLDPYLPVRIFGNFMLPAVVLKNLGVWFNANFSFTDHVCNIYKTCFIHMHDLRWVRQYLSDEATILADSGVAP